jgi:hypothetical protein
MPDVANTAGSDMRFIVPLLAHGAVCVVDSVAGSVGGTDVRRPP